MFLAGLLQEKYGYSRQRATEEIDKRVTEYEAKLKKNTVPTLLLNNRSDVPTPFFPRGVGLIKKTHRIIVAVLGAFLAGYFLSPILHIGTINEAFTVPTVLVTLVGSIILLAIFRLFRGRQTS